MSTSRLSRLTPLCLLALTACASSSTSPIDELRPQADYTLQPGDIVELVVWREEDMSGEFLVDRSGHVVLPRVGRWDVSDETESSLEQRLADALSDVLRDATLDVIVLRRIQVLGAVERPGLYALDNTVTLSDAVAEAGGANPDGRRDRVEIVRGGERYVLDMRRDHTLGEVSLRSGDALYVPQRSWFVRNYGAVITTVSSLGGLLVVLLTRN